MNTTRRFASVFILLISVASFVVGQSTYRTLSTGTWEATSTWEKSTDGTSWGAATTAPTSADSVIIRTGHTVTLTSSGKTCKSLTVQTGSQIRGDFVQPTSSIRYIRVYGGVVQIDGVFGRTDSADVLSLEAYGSFVIQGSGTARVCRIRPGSSQSNLTITISMDMTLTYVGGSGTGGSGLYTSNSSNDNITVTIVAGKTLTAANFCNVTTSSSSATDGAANTVLNINGNLVMQGGNFSMIVGAGKTCTVNVAGTLTTGKSVTLTGTTGVTSTINVSGTMNVGTVLPGTIDFSNSSQTVTGAGTFNVGQYATLNVGTVAGLNAATGPIRTTTASFDPKATYAYTGQAAQSTGALLPAKIARLTVNNAAGLSLTQSTEVDSTLNLTAGTLMTGANTLTVGSSGTVNRTAGFVIGNLKKIGVAALQKFDVGTATGYAPVEITPVSGSGDVTVKAVDGVHPNKPADESLLGMYWTLAGSGITNANITFSYPASLAGLSEPSYAAAYYTGSGTAWKLNPTTVNTTAHSATVNGVSNFTDWTLIVGPYDDPAKVVVKNAGAITVDGKLDEADWTGAPTLLYGLGAEKKKQAGEFTVTGSVDVKNPFTDNNVSYSVPHKDSSLARVKFLRKGLNLYIGIQSDDKSICKFGWEGDGLFMKIKTSAGQVKEYKLYWQNHEANKDTMRYEPGVASSGSGWGYLLTGSTVNDTANVDKGYTAELLIDLSKLGYTLPLTAVPVMINIFDPDGFKHPMNEWDHTIGSFHKSWWGSEWGDPTKTLEFTPEPFDDPVKVVVKNAGTITVDGKLDEADWTGAPALLYGLGAAGKKQAGEYTVTGGVDVKNPFTDNSVQFNVPHKDSSLARVKFLRKGLNLYIGIQSDDKSICKFGWEGDGLFMKIRTSAGQVREYKLYWQNYEANKDTMRYEPGVASSGSGWGYLPTGSTVNDTANVDKGYTAELLIDLSKLGYTLPLTAVPVMINIFDPDGFKHPMNEWDHTIGSFYKSWWGSEWGDPSKTLEFTAEPFDDPDSLRPKVATGTMTIDGEFGEADWMGAPTLLFGLGAAGKKQAGEFTVTGGVDVKNPFTDNNVQFSVPHRDSTLTRVKFLQKGLSLYIGIQSDDKSICKFGWEGDGLFMKIKTAAGQVKEYKLYWQNFEGNKDTMRYEPGVANSGAGWGYLPTGSTVNDTTNVDQGYTAELRIDLDKLGYTTFSTSAMIMLNIFDPDGFKHPMSEWDHTIGSFYKSWWGSEWGDPSKTLMLNNTTDVNLVDGEIPGRFALEQNYPNPFNPGTMINFSLPARSLVTLRVYDLLGREVAILADGELSAGVHRVAFNASELSTGMYVYRISATPLSGAKSEPFVAVKKLMLLK